MPKNLHTLLDKCRDLILINDFKLIVELHDENIDLFGTSDWLLYYWSESLFRTGNYNTCIEILLRILKRNSIDSLTLTSDGLCFLRLAECSNALREFTQAIEYGNKALKKFQNQNDSIGESRALFAQSAALMYLQQFDKAQENLNYVAQKSKDNDLLVYTNSLINLSTLYDISGNITKAIEILLVALNQTYQCADINKSDELIQQYGYPIATHTGYVRVAYNIYKPQINIYRSLITLLYKSGITDESLKYTQLGHELIKLHGTSEQIVLWCNDVASLMLENGLYTSAYELLTEAKQLISPSDRIDARGYIDLNLGKCKIQMKEFEDAHILLQNALQNFRKNKNTEEELNTIRHIGEILIKEQAYVKAEILLKDAIVVARKTQLLQTNIQLLLEYGKVLWLNNKKHCMKPVLEAIEIAQASNKQYILHTAYNLLSEYYEQNKKYADALKYQRLFNQTKAKFQNDTAIQRSQILTTLYGLEALRFKQQVLEKQSELDRANLDHLQNQLTMKTNAMLEQLKAVNQLRSDILDTLHDIDSAEAILGKVKRKLNASSVLRQDWNSFADVFNQVHPLFVKNLIKKYPELTKMEIRICTLLRTGMATEDMAQLLSLSERSIENHRLRLRKKMKLKRAEAIYAVISAL